MKCEYPQPCSHAATWRFGFKSPLMAFCAVHITVIVWKLFMEGRGEGFEEVQMVRL